ncbi:MAG: phosphotriesterase-related protein [Rhizomicrobium sp.]|jgi:phosphotriesterase-related protein
MRINTATGSIAVESLGKTLMHEHLVIGFPGWDSDTSAAGMSFRDMTAVCADRIAELKSAGFSTLLDPCPNDIGRDVGLMAEVASRTGFNIVFATGLYHHHLGGSAYWSHKFQYDPDAEKKLTDLLVKELTEGVMDTGIKAGVIKIATAMPPFTDYEKTIFRAAAKAALATGAPVTTHTDACMGDEQLTLLTSLGVPAHKIVIGHSCGSPDHDYHMKIVDGGAYIGFDRFGLEIIQPDSVRVESLLKLLKKGAGAQVVISHDSVWCWRGHMLPKTVLEMIEGGGQSMRFTRVIAPMLKSSGVSQAEIDSMLTDNPRRYFSGEPPPRRAA